MAPPLTIRNLTSTPIALRSLETFEDPFTKQSKATAFPSGSSGTTTIAPSADKLGAHAQTFHHEDLGVDLAPFESFTLKTRDPETVDTDPYSDLSSTTLRLVIENAGGERYRIDANPSHTQKASRTFTPLTPNPSTTLIALYHPSKPIAHLTVHANHLHNYARWMEPLPPELPLSALSIPGTHNAHTYYRALPSVRCQVNSVKVQLENGIRFLDIRVQPASATDTSKNDLYLVHGAFPVSLTGTKYFEPIVEACYKFLDENPNEAILISLKREGIGSSTDEHLAEILERHYISPNKKMWYTDDSIPYLGDVRGKLVLVRRYNIKETHPEPQACGLDATAWPHNSTHATHGSFCVQDWCEVMHPSSIPAKLQHSNDHLIRSAACTAFIPGINTDKNHPVPPGPLYLNFLSGSNFFRLGTWPEKIAKVVNRGIEEWVCMGHHLEGPLISPSHPERTSVEDGKREVVRRAMSGDGSTGVVVMDMVGENGDWDLVRMIVGMNMGVLLRIQEAREHEQ
ncbi:PLC-like phosphodiesterase [Lentithecium fluviatile CBS 122367]|uniref:PLC-like phosphodiesterase n=1 Tax=Lentithecium fluviatile CBS 122367 TaxID=1168545 RepID=A0A6G1J7G4_9PLEO|nr:PLC-like phosphodiesterase [Lentithecium fluviatile CBS 122367]